MSKRNIIISVVLACLLVTGAGFSVFYYWGSHHLDSVVPGKVYQYSSSLNGEVNNRGMYVAFQEGGNKALVSQDRTTVVNAAKSPCRHGPTSALALSSSTSRASLPTTSHTGTLVMFFVARSTSPMT